VRADRIVVFLVSSLSVLGALGNITALLVVNKAVRERFNLVR
jgi:hypothetical protein